jgi:hypothetical protein
MSNFTLPNININELYDYVVSTIEPKKYNITIYHFIIGSKFFEADFRNDTLTIKRNHEYPKVVENFLIDPQSQLSPEFISNLSNYNEITILQKLFLIDPYYKIKPEPLGLISKLKELQQLSEIPNCVISSNNILNSISITHNIKHNEFKNTKLISKLEAVIVPDYINEKQLLSLLRITKYFSILYPIIINIMDCSSLVATNIYRDSINSYTNNWCNVSKPYCLLNDSKTQFLPILTIDNLDSNLDSNPEQCEQPTDKLFTYNKINIRWMNYVTDNKSIDDLKSVSDFCAHSYNTYKYLTTQYKTLTIDYSMYSLYKLWSYTTYTNEHTFNDILPSNKTITANMSKLSFFEFASYWKINKNFRNLIIFNNGFDIEIINKFIDNFVNKYINKEGLSYLGINPSIVDILKLEAFEIFSIIIKYFPNDSKYISDIPSNIQRNLIREYLIENDVKF